MALLEKYGDDAVARSAATLIAAVGSAAAARLRELPDGRWTARQYMDVEGEPLEITPRDDQARRHARIRFRRDRARKSIAASTARAGARGAALLAPLYPLLCYDITWNEGVLRPVRMMAARGHDRELRPARAGIDRDRRRSAGGQQRVAALPFEDACSSDPAIAQKSTAVWHGSHLCLYLFGRNAARPGRDRLDDRDVRRLRRRPLARATASTSAARFPIRSRAWRTSRPTRRSIRSAICFGGVCRIPAAPGASAAAPAANMPMVPHDAPDRQFGFVVSGKGSRFPHGPRPCGRLSRRTRAAM